MVMTMNDENDGVIDGFDGDADSLLFSPSFFLLFCFVLLMTCFVGLSRACRFQNCCYPLKTTIIFSIRCAMTGQM